MYITKTHYTCAEFIKHIRHRTY